MKINVVADLDKYTQEQAGIFSLKNDKDTACIKFLYESMNDIEGHVVHRVKTSSGQYKYVECLREYDDPQEMCPCCASPNEEDRKLMTRIWIPVYDVDRGEVYLWERGKQFWQQQLYPIMVEKGIPFCTNNWNIIRHGAAGDTNTTYEILFEGTDSCKDLHAVFPEIPDPVGTLILQKDFDELENFVKTRSFDGKPAVPELPLRRRGTTSEMSNTAQRRGTVRPDIV